METRPAPKSAYAAIAALSIGALAFLFWLIYFKPPSTSGGEWVTFLPSVNASLNTLTALLLVFGFLKIKAKKIEAHKLLMISATASSALFLICYILYHHYHGDTKFLGTGWIRPVYFAILISHILLSMIQVPLIFTTLYFAFSGRMQAHKKIAKFTFPIWLYVSVTGVMVYFFLKSNS
jgi:putative membrane protein